MKCAQRRSNFTLLKFMYKASEQSPLSLSLEGGLKIQPPLSPHSTPSRPSPVIPGTLLHSRGKEEEEERRRELLSPSLPVRSFVEFTGNQKEGERLPSGVLTTI